MYFLMKDGNPLESSIEKQPTVSEGKSEGKKVNPFTLFLILILLILSDLGAMAVIVNILRQHYIGN
jgi:hypothetical protein